MSGSRAKGPEHCSVAASKRPWISSKDLEDINKRTFEGKLTPSSACKRVSKLHYTAAAQENCGTIQCALYML